MTRPSNSAAHNARGLTYVPDEDAVAADDFLTVREAAVFLRTSKSYLDKSRLTGDGPPFFRIGRKILYGRRILQRWIEQRQYRSTSEYD